VFIVSEKTSPHEGFSRNLTIFPSSVVITIPYCKGLLTLVNVIVAIDFFFKWKLIISDKLKSVSISPDITKKSSLRYSFAKAVAPQVPKSSSEIIYLMFTPNFSPSLK